MSSPDEDPRCPHCGEPIGMTATYCMHCSADLTDERDAADVTGDGYWDADGADAVGAADAHAADTGSGNGPGTGSGGRADDGSGGATVPGETLLAPDGLLDDSLTVAVGVVGGFAVGVVGTFVLVGVTESVRAFPAGILAWLLATAHLVRRRTVQGAISRAAYAVAVVLLLVPLVAFSPGLTGTFGDRVREFGVLLLLVAVPALVAVGVGRVAARFVPDAEREG